MWAPSTPICPSVNSGVLMVSHVSASLRGFRWRCAADGAKSRLRVWDEYMSRSGVRVDTGHNGFYFLFRLLKHCSCCSALMLHSLPRWSLQQTDGQEPLQWSTQRYDSLSNHGGFVTQVISTESWRLFSSKLCFLICCKITCLKDYVSVHFSCILTTVKQVFIKLIFCGYYY